MIDGWVQWVGSAAARFTGGTGMAAGVHSGRVKDLAGDKKNCDRERGLANEQARTTKSVCLVT